MIPRRRAHVLPNEFMELERRAKGDPEASSVLGAWEDAIASHTGTKHAVAMNSGRRAMLVILRHLGVGQDAEVIVPGYTLFSLLPLIKSLGAHPVPVDISPDTLNMRPEYVERAITPKTKAIIVLHAFGTPCEVEAIISIGERYGIPVVEDCAHSMGASVGVRRTGALGVAGFFSFEPTKPVNTYGGGILVTDDAGLASFARAQTVDDVPRPKILLRKVRAVQMEQLLYRSNLMLPVLVALNNRLFNLVFNGVYRRFQAVPPADSAYLPVQAEIGLRKLTTLEDRIARRESLVHLYRELLKPVIKLQQLASKDRSTWYFLVATLPVKAATVRQRILLRGIDCAVESEIADDCATAMNLDKCPVVRELYPRLMALPLYDSMTENEVARVARAINDRV